MEMEAKKGRVASPLVSLLLVFAVLCISACSAQTYYEVAPVTPIAVSPQPTEVLKRGQSVRFVWRETADTEHYEFHIFDRTTADIDRYYVADIDPQRVCLEGVCAITHTLELPVDNGHAWRVRSSNRAGKSPWSRVLMDVQ